MPEVFLIARQANHRGFADVSEEELFRLLLAGLAHDRGFRVEPRKYRVEMTRRQLEQWLYRTRPRGSGETRTTED